jgi:hypothetical protein
MVLLGLGVLHILIISIKIHATLIERYLNNKISNKLKNMIWAITDVDQLICDLRLL